MAEVKQEIEATLAQEPDNIDTEFGNVCDPDVGYHSKQCDIDIELHSLPCILERVQAARVIESRIHGRDLLTICAQDPLEANGHLTLQGIAADTCIYEAQ